MKKKFPPWHKGVNTRSKQRIRILPAKEKLVKGRHAPQMSSQLKTNFFALPIHEIWSNFRFLTFALRCHFFLGRTFFLSSDRTFECPGRPDICPIQMSGHLSHPNVRTDILTKFDLEKNFCPTVPVHVLRRMAKSQVPGTQNVRVRTCQSSLN